MQVTKRQAELPGTERPCIPAIDERARAYVDTRDERMRLTKQEVEDKQALSEAMHEHEDDLERDDDEQLVYKFVDGDEELTCVVKRGKESLKVSRAPIYDPADDEVEIG